MLSLPLNRGSSVDIKSGFATLLQSQYGDNFTEKLNPDILVSNLYIYHCLRLKLLKLLYIYISYTYRDIKNYVIIVFLYLNQMKSVFKHFCDFIVIIPIWYLVSMATKVSFEYSFCGWMGFDPANLL